jgi:DNA-binding transcriptional ArsR family regulator
MFRDLDPVLHSQVRLAVISLLMGVRSAEFSYLLECTQTTKGNLSFQLRKLTEAGYIDIKKSFRGNYPLTTCEITVKGAEAFENYVESISDYLNKDIR